MSPLPSLPVTSDLGPKNSSQMSAGFLRLSLVLALSTMQVPILRENSWGWSGASHISSTHLTTSPGFEPSPYGTALTTVPHGRL
ncbi:hypothetical protein TNCV_921561 [Trichonephila clavipes]|nr:hypothetical protein TNCV_921561 [Trichonephila clavipes]